MTDYMPATTISDLIRTAIVTLIDRPAYFILCIMYQIFFNVATAELFSNALIKDFYYRCQLIIGVFMLFKFAVTILEGIVDPNRITDKKNGAGKIITRIITSLIILALITPINIPNPRNEWERQLNNNGIIFGALYSLQNRILSNNTIGKLVLGTTDVETTGNNNSSPLNGTGAASVIGDVTDAISGTDTSANRFAGSILRAFLRINLIDKSKWKTEEGKDPEYFNENRACPNMSEDLLKVYTNQDASPQELLTLVNVDCDTASGSSLGALWGFTKKLFGASTYAFAYSPFLGGIAALVIAIILIGYTVDVAIRAIKLAILRLIAPIPIISHMSISAKEAKGEDSFSLWTKTLVSTYLDLFMRLIIIYFVIYLIQDMLQNGIVIKHGTGLLGAISFVFIVIGLFLFARQAPKFIQSALGIQSTGGSIALTMAAAGIGTYLGGGKAKDVYENMMSASRTVQNGGKDPGKAAIFAYRDNQIKGSQAKYREGLQDEAYKRLLDIDDQDENGFVAPRRARIPLFGSDKLAKAQRDDYALEQNRKRYQANWRTHERSTGRGATVRGGSEFHTRTDAYPQPTPSGQQGVPPSGPQSRQRGDAVDQSLGIETYQVNPRSGKPYQVPNGGSGYAASGSNPYVPPALPPKGGTTGSNNNQGQP